jgi:glyoxylase-like metal-dependent hydrolase (beta-lactamase superfamily II)
MRLAWLFLLAVGAFVSSQGVSVAADSTEVAPGVHLLPGRFAQGRQPDGNTIIFRTPEGLIVVDTGRHREHTEQIFDFSARTGSPIRAVVNTHWHLDHIGGNALIRRRSPGVVIHASPALGEARKGFLAGYRGQLEEAIRQAGDDSAAVQSFRTEAALIDSGQALEPDSLLRSSGERTLFGRKLILNLEEHAVTAGDVWIYDPETRVLVAGDLVTLPAPFFDTACPSRWMASLDRLLENDFQLLVPGHGPPMTRDDLKTYRDAFHNLLSCSASDSSKERCIEGWTKDAGDLIAKQDADLSRLLIGYYIDNHLRGDPARTKVLCGE